MTSPDLRPLETGELLDEAFNLFRTHFGTLVTIAVVALGVPSLLQLYHESLGGWAVRPGMGVLVGLLQAIGGLFAAGASVFAISEAYLGREPTVGDALNFAGSKAWRLFVAGLARYLVIGLALLALIVPGIIVALGYAVVTQVVVLEKLDAATEALGRSWALTRGYKGKVFKLALAMFGVVLVVYMGFGLAFGLFLPGQLLLANALSAVLWLVLQPLFACVFTLLYYDLRVRQEAFDLEQLGQAVGPQQV